MVRFLGYGPAAAILWSEGRLVAERARRLGLLNEVSPPAELESCAWRAAERFARKSHSRLGAVKRLLSSAHQSWDDYSRVEQREVNRCLNAIAREKG
jgi:enoyl-CoA hydratase/carnithine racemase